MRLFRSTSSASVSLSISIFTRRPLQPCLGGTLHHRPSGNLPSRRRLGVGARLSLGRSLCRHNATVFRDGRVKEDPTNVMVDLGLLAHHTAPVVGCFFDGSSSVAKLVTPVAALLLRKMLRKLDLKHGEAHAAQRRGGSAAAALEPSTTPAAPVNGSAAAGRWSRLLGGSPKAAPSARGCASTREPGRSPSTHR